MGFIRIFKIFGIFISSFFLVSCIKPSVLKITHSKVSTQDTFTNIVPKLDSIADQSTSENVAIITVDAGENGNDKDSEENDLN